MFYAIAPRPWVVDETGSGWGLPAGAECAVDLSAAGMSDRVFVGSSAPFASGDVHATFGDGQSLIDAIALGKRERSAWATLFPGFLPASGASLADTLWEILTAQSSPDGDAGPKPIMPTHRGVLELFLGAQSPVRAERLPADVRSHRSWPAIQRVLQNGYRDIHDGGGVALGRGFRGRQGGSPELARKWLGAMALKYRLPPEDARDLLIPAGMARELPLTPTTTISDDFDRADGSVGPNWTAVGAGAPTWAILGNELSAAGDSAGSDFPAVLRHETALSSDDHYAEADYTWDDGGSDSERYGMFCGAVRIAASGKQAYTGRVSRGGTYAIQRVEGEGNFTTIASGSAVAMGLPYGCRLEAAGSTITVSRGGTVVGAVTDTTITVNLHAGIGAHPAYPLRGDNFLAADRLAGAIVATADQPITVTQVATGSVIVGASGDQRIGVAQDATAEVILPTISCAADQSLGLVQEAVADARIAASADQALVVDQIATAEAVSAIISAAASQSLGLRQTAAARLPVSASASQPIAIEQEATAGAYISAAAEQGLGLDQIAAASTGGVPTPTSRVYRVPFSGRVYRVPAVSKTYVVAA